MTILHVRTRHAPPARLLLGVSQNVRLEIGGLCELLVTALNMNSYNYNHYRGNVLQCLPQKDKHKACLQYVFLREFLS